MMFPFEIQSPSHLLVSLQSPANCQESRAQSSLMTNSTVAQLSPPGKNPSSQSRLKGLSQADFSNSSSSLKSSAFSQNLMKGKQRRTPSGLPQLGAYDGDFNHINGMINIGLGLTDFTSTGSIRLDQAKSIIILRLTLIQLKLSQELIDQLRKLQILQGSLTLEKLGLSLQMSQVNPAQKLHAFDSKGGVPQSQIEEKKIHQRDESKKESEAAFDQHLQEVLKENDEEKSMLKKQISSSQAQFIELLTQVAHPQQLIFKGQPRGSVRKNGQPYTSSQYRGVSKNGKKYQMFIMVNGKRKMYIGGYETSAEAGRAYDRAAIQMRGIKAKTNFSYNKMEVLDILRQPAVFSMEDENLKETLSIWRNHQMKQGHL